MTTTPIPQRLAHLPVQAGLAVPVVAIQLGDRYAISVNHTRKVHACLENRLCGICGHPLNRPMVVLTGEEGVRLGYATDPANHPECAAYASSACPMLNGRQTHYRPQAERLHGDCDKAGCKCGGYVRNPLSPQHDRTPAPAGWVAVWLNDYTLAVNGDGVVIGLAWDEPLKVRPVRRSA